MAHRGSTEIFIPVQKYLSQYKNIYPSTKIFIPVQKYLSQYKNIYPSTKIFIPVQKYLSQYKNIFPVQKYLSQYKNIYPSTKIFFPVQKYFLPVQIENGIYFPRGHCELHWSTCEYGSSFRGLGRRGGLTVSALYSGASAPGSSPGWGHCVVFLGKTLTLTVPLSTQECKWVPTNCWGNQTNLGSHLRWTSTPSRRGRNTPSRFVLRSHLARKAHFFAACFRHCCSFKIVDPAYRYCPKCGTEVFRVASSAESTSNSTEPPDSLKTRKFSLPSFKSYKAKKGSERSSLFRAKSTKKTKKSKLEPAKEVTITVGIISHCGHISGTFRAIPVSWIHAGSTCKLDLQQWQKQAAKGAVIFTCAPMKLAMISGKLDPIPYLYWKNIFVLGKIFLYWEKYFCTGKNIFVLG